MRMRRGSRGPSGSLSPTVFGHGERSGGKEIGGSGGGGDGSRRRAEKLAAGLHGLGQVAALRASVE